MLLRTHLHRFGTDEQGRLFRGERGGELASITYTRVWARARRAAFTADAYDSSLARRPYDLRHAAVSTWLNGGVPSTEVAEWAGHSVAVLHEVYAKCLDGRRHASRERVEDALGGAEGSWDVGVSRTRIGRGRPAMADESQIQPDRLL